MADLAAPKKLRDYVHVVLIFVWAGFLVAGAIAFAVAVTPIGYAIAVGAFVCAGLAYWSAWMLKPKETLEVTQIKRNDR